MSVAAVAEELGNSPQNLNAKFKYNLTAFPSV